jgi:hypothetical protein
MTTLATVEGRRHMVGAILFPAGGRHLAAEGTVGRSRDDQLCGGGGSFGGRGFAGRTGARAAGCNVTMTGFGL